MFETQRKVLAAGIALAALAGTAACNQRAGAANRDANRDGVEDTMPATNAGADWTDAKILRALVTTNAMDSMVGAFAVKAAHSPGVKDYARTMMRDHGATNTRANELAKNVNIPYDSAHIDEADPQVDVVQDAADKMNDLRKLQALEFDKGYIQSEVSAHEDMLKTIDSDLIPNARHADLRGFLEQVRPTVVAHLEKAKMLKAELDRGAVPAGTR